MGFGPHNRIFNLYNEISINQKLGTSMEILNYLNHRRKSEPNKKERVILADKPRSSANETTLKRGLCYEKE